MGGTSTLTLTSDQAVPKTITGSPVSDSANLQQSELNLISIPSAASLLGSGPILQFGGSSTSRVWIDSIEFDCISCRQLVFECSASDSCELRLPSSESGTAAGSGVSLNVSNSDVADSLILFRSRSNLLVEQPLYLASHSSRPVQFIAGSNCVVAHQSSGSLEGNFITNQNGTIWANDQDLNIQAWSVLIQSSLNLNPNTHSQTGTTGNLYIDACPGASGLVTPGMDVAIGTPNPSNSQPLSQTLC